MSLKTKLVAFCLCIGLIPLAVIGVYSVNLAGQSLQQQAQQQLVSARDARRNALEGLAQVWFNEVRIFGANKGVYHALGFLRDKAYGADVKGSFDTKGDDYVSSADNVRSAFVPFVEVLGYGDAMLIDDYGWVLISVGQGGELGRNVEGPALQGTNLARAWKEAKAGKVVFVDFEPYPILGGEPTAFIAAPVFNHTGASVEGAAVLRVSRGQINALMQQRSGMGESGETLLVGPDFLMRSDSTLSPERFTVAASFANPQKNRIETEPVRKALAGETGVGVVQNHLGEKVLCAYAPAAIGGSVYALVAEINAAEAFGAVDELRLAALILGLLTALGVVFLSWFVVRRELGRPLDAVIAYLQEITEGNLQARLRGAFTAEMAALAGHLRGMVAELKQKLGFSDGILRNMTIPCYVTDLENKLTFVNQPLLALLEERGGPGDFIGRDADRVLHPCGLPEGLAVRCLDAGTSLCNLEQDITGCGGTLRHVRMDAAPLHDLDGNPTGAFVLITDLTDIRRQEARIRDQNELVARVAQEAEAISQYVFTDSRQIKDKVALVTDGARRQNSRITETSVAMQEMNATLYSVAQSAAEAARSAEESRKMALEGSGVIQGSSAAIGRVREISLRLEGDMRDLDKRAEGIGSVIDVISDIADQTNLLALNAAIEAARAGDAGRGFAVVADEVRKLAEKTMNATREVAGAIQAIQKAAHDNLGSTSQAVQAVEEATGLVLRSNESLSRIVSLADNTAARVAEIASASEQQSAAHEQINRSMEEVRLIADDTSTGMTESRRSIDHLAVQAEQLQKLITTITQ